ncbi:hypothetical protein ABKV19_002624 [Rosa sericea]
MSGNTGTCDGSKKNGFDDSKKDNSDGSQRNLLSMIKRRFRDFVLPSYFPTVFGVPPHVRFRDFGLPSYIPIFGVPPHVRFRGFGLPSYFPIFGVPLHVHTLRQEGNAIKNQERQPLNVSETRDRAILQRHILRRLWLLTPVLILLSVGGSVYFSGISWSDFEALSVSKLQLFAHCPLLKYSH